MSVNIVNKIVIECDVLFFDVDLFSSRLNIFLDFPLYSDLSLLALLIPLVNTDLNPIYLLQALDLRTLWAHNEPNKALVNPHFFEVVLRSLRRGGGLLHRFHGMFHVLALRVQENICLDSRSF